MRFYALTLWIMALLTSSTFAQQGSHIDSKDIKKFVTLLSADSLEGRGTGSEGQRKAAQFIVERFKSLGLQPLDSSGYLERFTLRQLYWNDVFIKTRANVLENFTNMVFQGNHPINTTVEKEVVFGGTGSDAELNQLDVTDRFVLIFVDNLRSYYTLNQKLQKRNAYGLILANPRNEIQFESIKKSFREYALQKRYILAIDDTMKKARYSFLDTLKSINTILIPNDQIKNLLGMPRKNLEKLNSEGRLKDIPLARLTVKFEKIENEIETANVVAKIQGKSDQTIVVSAHYDHLGKLGKDVFPGADDNASGVAALLELAEEFSKSPELPYSITFVATTGEEAGLLGSEHHVNKRSFNAKNVICNLNIDMISRRDDTHATQDYLYCIGTDQSLQLDKLVRKADKSYSGCTIDFTLNDSKSSFFSRSDNYNFYSKGIPSLHFFAGFHPDYHKPSDTPEKIDYKNLEKRIRLISEIIKLIQQEGLDK